MGRPWLSQTSCGLDRADLLWFGQRRAGVVLPKVGTMRQEAQPPEIAAQSCSILTERHRSRELALAEGFTRHCGGDAGYAPAAASNGSL